MSYPMHLMDQLKNLDNSQATIVDLAKNFKIPEIDFIQPVELHFHRWGLQNTQETDFVKYGKYDFQ